MSIDGAYHPGRHFLPNSGPSNVPESVLRAMAQPVIDHRGRNSGLTFRLLEARPYSTLSPLFIYPASGTGGWECALLNCLSLGDKVLAFETGHFATLWKEVAEKLGLHILWIPGDWRHRVDPSVVEEKLSEDGKHEMQAVLAVHTETSTGVTSRIGDIRRAMTKKAPCFTHGGCCLLSRLHRVYA